MLRKLFWLGALTLLAPWAVQAQTTVEGRVLAPSGDPVPAVTITLTNRSAAVRVATADSTGRFAFLDVAAGSYTLRAERIGFVPLVRAITVGSVPLRLDLNLVDAPVSIAGVTVEGQRMRARFENQAGATTRELTRDELKLIPGLAESDVLRAVEALPGVISTSDFSSSYNVRGGSADQNLILLDGIPIYNPFHVAGVFSIFNSDMVERAELLAGGFPAEYGGRVSSVLNVISDVSTADFDVSGGVSVLATRVSVGGPVSPSTRVRVGVRRSYFDQLLKPIFDFPYHLGDLQLGAESFTKSGSRISATAYIGNDVLDFSGVDDFPLQLDWEWGNAVLGAAWTKTLRNGGQIDVRSSYSRFKTNILFPDFNDVSFNSVIDHSLIKGGITLPHATRNELKFGFELNRLHYANRAEAGGTVFRHGSDVGWQPSLYGQIVFRPNARWLIETGMREDLWITEESSPTLSELSPRLAIKRFFGDGNAAVKLALGRYTQFLHSLRDEEFPVGIDVWVLSGLRAPHVVSNQVQAGFEWFPAASWYLAVEAYHRKFDGVATNNFADDPNDQTDDLLSGEGLSYGADAVIRKDAGRLRGFVTVSWLRAWREFPDILSGEIVRPKIRYPPLFDRRVEIDAVMRFRLPRNWDAGVRWNFGSSLPYTRPIGSYLFYNYRVTDGRKTLDDSPDSAQVAVLLQPRNTSRYPAYHRLDISFRKDFQKRWGLITPYLDILNIYNRKNVLFYFYDYNKQPAMRAGVSMFPFLPTIGMELKF
jgi:hypothetical protein